MFHQLGRVTSSSPWAVCAAWLAAGLFLTAVAPAWDSKVQDDDIRFLPDRCPSVRGYHLLEQAFPQDVFASKLVFAVEQPDRPLTKADIALVGRLVEDLEKLRKEEPDLKIGNVTSCKDPVLGSRLTSADGHCTLIQVSLGTPFLALQTQAAVDRARAVLANRLREAGPDAPRLYTTGSAGVGRDLVTVAGESLDATTLATVALVVIVLLLVYRAPLLALVPLVTLAVSVWIALNILALATLIPGVHLVNVSKVFAIVILYGAGTDYCLFLISRYREELANGKKTGPALGHTVGTVGGALAASAGTVMIGLGLMATAEFAKVRYAGPAIALGLGVALLASLTLTPALLQLLGPVVFWPGRAPRPVTVPRRNRRIEVAPPRGAWAWISNVVVAQPLAVWCAAVLLLAPLAWIGFRVTPNYRPTGELSPNCDSLKGLQAIQQHFTAGETGPITVLLVSDKDWNSREGRAEIDHLSAGFARLDNVAEVRSLTRPLGSPLPELPSLKTEGPFGKLLRTVQPRLRVALRKAQDAAREHYTAGLPGGRHVTRLDVVLKSDPFDPASAATLKLLQTWLSDELPFSSLLSDKVESETYGVTVLAQDLAEVTERDRLRVNVLISLGIFLILLALVRRPGFALYLLLTVLFSYYATLGATVLGGTFWTGRPLEQVDWRVPFFLFTILVAVGEDYNILLVTRALQEKKKHGAVEGMRQALARTGGTITSCGLIMAGTFATLMLAGLGTLKQIGFSLAFGVLLDTFIVRPFLVPAFALLFGKRREAAAEETKPLAA
jgi:RND superfamily putative drug exporter